MPPLLRQIIGGRVARLGAGAGQLLALAASSARRCRSTSGRRRATADEEALADAVGRAGRAGAGGNARRRRGPLRPRAGPRGALRGRSPCPGGGRSTGASAEALMATANPDPDAVAEHLQRAGDPRAVEWLVQAGDRALRAYRLPDGGGALRSRADAARWDRANPGLRGWCLLYLSRRAIVTRVRRNRPARGGASLSAEAGDRALAAYAAICSASTAARSATSGRGSRR